MAVIPSGLTNSSLCVALNASNRSLAVSLMSKPTFCFPCPIICSPSIDLVFNSAPTFNRPCSNEIEYASFTSPEPVPPDMNS